MFNNLLRRDVNVNTLADMCSFRGDITCDGVNVEKTGHKYYDFIVHCFDV